MDGAVPRTLELYSTTEVKQFSTAICEKPDDDYIGRNMKCTNDVQRKVILKLKKLILRF
jgi:hypothetical protein